MKKVLANLRRSLTGNGELYLWIYGKHGRYRHSLNVRLLSMLLRSKAGPADRVEFAREFVHNGGNGSVLSDLLGAVPVEAMQRTVFEDPVWIADQFLNPQEKLLDMEDLLGLVSSSGFSIEHLLGVDETLGKLLSPPLRERFQKLSRNQQLIALDLLLKPERYFVALRTLRKRT
jgi:hypothetical protein